MNSSRIPNWILVSGALFTAWSVAAGDWMYVAPFVLAMGGMTVRRLRAKPVEVERD